MGPCWVTCLSSFSFFLASFPPPRPQRPDILQDNYLATGHEHNTDAASCRLTVKLAFSPRAEKLPSQSASSCRLHHWHAAASFPGSPPPFSPRKAPALVFLFSSFFSAFPHQPSRWPRNKTESVGDRRALSRPSTVPKGEGAAAATAAATFITAIKSCARGRQRRVCLLLSSPTLICLSESEGITKIN